MNEVDHREITKRIKGLISKNKISEYRVRTKTKIPSASFSNMINNKAPWKLDHLMRIATFFNVTCNWLVHGKEEYLDDLLTFKLNELEREIKSLKNDIKVYEKIVEIVNERESKNNSKIFSF
jgi:hypothetical protein